MINEEITDKEVRLIGKEGEQLGVVSVIEAQRLADEKELDLVKIAPQGVPPVCKIMDYGKYRFELTKKEKENRKNQKIVDIKEIKMTPSIDTHDFETKMNHGKKFLTDGDKLKVTIRFRGREINHSSLGVQLLERVEETLKDWGSVEKRPKIEGRTMFMIVAPIEKKECL
ncbi:MAG: translation initiation factor IF-3 [Bacillota bacterium]|nr:translation initiation factor IF-3 [Bacillota bacterium]